MWELPHRSSAQNMTLALISTGLDGGGAHGGVEYGEIPTAIAGKTGEFTPFPMDPHTLWESAWTLSKYLLRRYVVL